MVMSFEELKDVVHLHDELNNLKNNLEKNTKIAVIFENNDNPGINYNTYSDKIKDIIKTAVDVELTRLEYEYKKNLNVY